MKNDRFMSPVSGTSCTRHQHLIVRHVKHCAQQHNSPVPNFIFFGRQIDLSSSVTFVRPVPETRVLTATVRNFTEDSKFGASARRKGIDPLVATPDERNHRRSSAGLAKRRKRTGATISPVICNFFIAVSRRFPGERTCMREEGERAGKGRNDSVRPRCSLATLQITSCLASRIPNFGPRDSLRIVCT